MATTAIERKLLLDGQWVETGEWLEVLSPYDGSLVGRVARGGPAETLRGIDAAERAMASPLPAHERAAILDRVAALLKERHDEVAQTISAEAGKPMKAARVEAERAVSTYTMAAVEARRLAGEVVPMWAAPKRFRAAHRRVDPEPARGVVRGRHDAPPTGVSADHERLVAKLGMLELLDRCEEGVEIEVRDDLRRTCHD